MGLVYHVRSSGLDVVGSMSVTQASGQTWQVDRGVTGRCCGPGFPVGNPGIMDDSDEGLQSALFTARTAFEAFTTALARYALFSAYCALIEPAGGGAAPRSLRSRHGFGHTCVA